MTDPRYSEPAVAPPQGQRPAHENPAHEGKERQESHSGRRGSFLKPVLITLVLILIAAVVITGILDRTRVEQQLARTTAEESVPKVSLISPEPAPRTQALELPGNVAAWYEAPIYGQVSGYVKMWYADFGAHVRKGQILAVIDTPYLDQQLDKARANLAVAQAKYKLAEVTARRWKALQGTQAVSQQEIDVKAADAEAQQAEVVAQQHNVMRFEALESFKNIVAPFDGVVTARRTDVGDYVNAGGGDVGSQGHSSELFSVADIHAMRVFVAVPQDYAGYIKPGLTATFSLAQYPGHVFTAHFQTMAQAFNTESRTVTTELTVDNKDQELWPGTFVTVHFTIPADTSALVIPAQTLLFRADGLLVGIVGSDHKVHLRKVQVSRNLGSKVIVTGGLKMSDQLVPNPSEGLVEGERVDVVERAPAGPQGKTEVSPGIPTGR